MLGSALCLNSKRGVSFDHSLQLYVAVLSRVTRDVQRTFLSEGERMDTAARDHVHTNTLCGRVGEGVGGRRRGQSSVDRVG